MAARFIVRGFSAKGVPQVQALLQNTSAPKSAALGHFARRCFQTSPQNTLLVNQLLTRPTSILASQVRPSSSLTSYDDTIAVQSNHGLPMFLIPLPSRHEKCQFVLKPISNNLGDLVRFLQEEDHGIDRVAAYNSEGERIARATTIDVLLKSDFYLVINDNRFLVPAAETMGVSNERSQDIGQIKDQVAKLYSALNVEQHQMEREKELLERLENIRTKLAPMEDLRLELEEKGKKRTNFLAWTGLGLMGFQFGLLARLTWFEYSWDIMEPVTYFVTYGTAMAMFAYYVLTKQEYNFADVRDREHLITLHRNLKGSNFDLAFYNQLRDALAQTELDLQRLRDPLQMQLPMQQVLPKSKEEDIQTY